MELENLVANSMLLKARLGGCPGARGRGGAPRGPPAPLGVGGEAPGRVPAPFGFPAARDGLRREPPSPPRCPSLAPRSRSEPGRRLPPGTGGRPADGGAGSASCGWGGLVPGGQGAQLFRGLGVSPSPRWRPSVFREEGCRPVAASAPGAPSQRRRAGGRAAGGELEPESGPRGLVPDALPGAAPWGWVAGGAPTVPGGVWRGSGPAGVLRRSLGGPARSASPEVPGQRGAALPGGVGAEVGGRPGRPSARPRERRAHGLCFPPSCGPGGSAARPGRTLFPAEAPGPGGERGR